MPGMVDLLVLRDVDGNLYALPWETVQAARIPDSGRAALDDMLDGDVAGFGMPALDSGVLGDMGTVSFFHLQMPTDQHSAMMGTLSGILNKSSDTSSGIGQNLK